MQMPKVQKCEVSQCAYNRSQTCHALAITVGDGAHPACDTFCVASSKGGDSNATGCVGACKVSICKFNSNLECQAQSITVVNHQQKCADCGTFQPR